MQYEDRLESIERELAELRSRLERLERAPAAGATEPEAQPEPKPPRPPAPRPAQPTPWARPEPAPPAAPRPPARPAIDLEELLGGRVLAWLGGAAVVLGVVFFLATAIRRGWIDETTRVVLAYFGATALLVLGLYLYERHGRTQAALAAVAAAVAGLFASTTAATQLYGLVDPTVGLAVAGVVGAAATAIAVRWTSPVVAGIGIVGAVLSPVLVEAGTSGVSLAFMAVALLSATVVLIWQRWNWLAAAAFVTSAPQLIAWIVDTYDEALILTLVVIALFWAVYVVAAVGYELRVPTSGLRFASASLLLADALLTAGAGWAALTAADHGDAASGWVIGVAAAHVLLGSITMRGRISREIALLLLAIGIGLSAIGLALALDGPALVAAWAVEAVLLTWLARRMGRARGYLAAGGFLALAAAHTLTVDAPADRLVGDPDVTAVVAVVLVIVAAALCARLYAGPWAEPRLLAYALAIAGLAYLPPIGLEGVPVVAAWTAIAVGLALVAGRWVPDDLALAAPGFLALAAGHVVIIEAPPLALRDGVEDLAAATLAIALATLGTYAVVRLRTWPEPVRPLLEIAVAVGAIYLPSIGIVELTSTGDEFEPGQTPQVLLSAFWSLAGLGAVVYGLVRDERRFRVGGLALLGVAVAKVFLYDLAELDEIYRVLSFIALGLLLLAGAFAYQRIRHTAGRPE
jgi:uncharacterized membrane protein